jgi:HEAT repeat protein
LTSTDKRIRKFALDILKGIHSEKSSLLALKAIHEEDENVSQTAIEVLGIHKYKAATEKLLIIMDTSESVWILNSVIIALGIIGQVSVKTQIEQRINRFDEDDFEKGIVINAYIKVLGNLGNIVDLEKVIYSFAIKYSISDETLLCCLNNIINRSKSSEFSVSLLSDINKLYKKILKYENESITITSIKAAVKINLDFFLKDICNLIKKFSSTEFFTESLFDIIAQMKQLPYEFILELLTDTDIAVKIFALKIIQLNKDIGCKNETDKNQFRNQVEEICDSQDRKVSVEALKIIAQIEYYYNETILGKYCESPYIELSKVAMQGMAKYKENDINFMLQNLKHSNIEIRKAASVNLIKIKEKIRADELISIIKELGVSMGFEALRVLIHINIFKAEQFIKFIFESNDKDIRIGLVQIVDMIDDEDIYYKYILSLVNDPSPDVRRKVIRSLGTRNGNAFGFLCELLENETASQNKYEIISILHKYKNQISFDLMKKYLQSSDILVKLAAIKSLGLFGNKEAIQLLREYVESDDEDLRDTAKESFDMLEVIE